MTITFKELEQKIKSLTELLLNMPDSASESASEIWIKFRNEGHYIVIDFENPLPEKIELQKLIGSGNTLNCSDYKRDNLISLNNTYEVKIILQNSVNYQSNMDSTVLSVIQLFDTFTERILHD